MLKSENAQSTIHRRLPKKRISFTFSTPVSFPAGNSSLNYHIQNCFTVTALKIMNKYRSFLPCILLVLLTIPSLIHYFPQVTQVEKIPIIPLWEWPYSIFTILAVGIIIAINVLYAKCKDKPLLIPAKKQWIIQLAAVLLVLTGNPWLKETYYQIPYSVLYITFGILLSVCIFRKWTFILFPAIFFILTIINMANRMGFHLGFSNLIQVFSTTWEDAKIYFSIYNIVIVAIVLTISLLAGITVCRLFRNEHRFALFNTACIYFIAFLITLKPQELHIPTGWNYVWPHGCLSELTYNSIRAIRVSNRMSKLLDALPQSEVSDTKSDILKPDMGVVCILHVGESLNAGHLSLNGYNRKTTPWLDSQPNLINFRDCVSSADLTDRALVPILTNGRRNMEKTNDKQYLPTSPGIMDFFSACGFQCASFWHGENLEQNNMQYLAQQIKYFCRKSQKNYSYYNDIFEQIPQVESFLKQQGKQNIFLLINNYGSHFYFSNYDKTNPPFPVKTAPSPASSPQSNADDAADFINAYDNTVHYTDKFIKAVTEKLTGRPYIYIYVGDHGEPLGENGIWSRGSENANKMFHSSSACMIPFFIHTSSEFENLSPHFHKALENARKHQNINTAHEHVFHTILGIMGIQTKYYDSRFDLSNHTVHPYSGPHPSRQGKEASYE